MNTLTKQKQELYGLSTIVKKLREQGITVGESTLRNAANAKELDATLLGPKFWATSLEAVEKWLHHKEKRRKKSQRPRLTSPDSGVS